MTTSETQTANRFQEVFGVPSGRAATKVVDRLEPYVQEFIQASPFVVMATSDAQGNCDASPKGGQPGFVKILDDKHLLLPDVAGNKLFQSYENLDVNPHVGLVFLIPGINGTVRVNGKVAIVNKEELERREVAVSLYEPDERGYHLQGIVIEVEEAYTHCPRALHFSQLWNTETIEAHKAEPPVGPRP